MTFDDIDDFNFITSSIGNAYFSGLTFDQLWKCISMSKTREELDASIEASIRLCELTKTKEI